MFSIADLPFSRSITTTIRKKDLSALIESLESRQMFDAAPTVELLSPPEVSTNSYALHVRYSDDTGISFNSIDLNDIRLSGPNGTEILANGLAVSLPVNGSIDATYFFPRAVGPGTYSFNLQPNEVFDDASNPVPAATLAQVEETIPLDTEAPKARLTRKPQLIDGLYTFDITFTDNVALNTNGLIFMQGVRVAGPRGYDEPAQLLNFGRNPDGSVFASYAVPAPLNVGAYRIVLLQNAITDTSGNSVQAGTLATFIVKPQKPH